MKRVITTDPMDIKKVIQPIMNHPIPTNLISLMKWFKSLKYTTYQNIPKKNKLKRHIPIEEFESIINNLPKQKAPSPGSVTEYL